jgi:hypothetical protein
MTGAEFRPGMTDVMEWSWTGCCPNTFFAYLLCTPWVKVFLINLRLTSGNDKTRFQLKQLSLLIFRFAKTGSAQHLRSAIISIFLTGKTTGLQLLYKTLSMATQKVTVWATTRRRLMQCREFFIFIPLMTGLIICNKF